METETKLLSNRYKDDSRAFIDLPRSAVEAVKRIRKEILAGGIRQISHEKCPLCSAKKAYLIACKDRIGLPVKNVICQNCGLLFSDTYLDRRSAAYYFKKYCNIFTNKGSSAKEMFERRTAPGSYSQLRYNWVKENLGADFFKIKTVMEIGANDGCNLYPYYRQGCTIFGCDFDEDRMDAGRAHGITLLSGGVEKLIELPQKADLVIFSHSLEYMPDVVGALEAAKGLLAPEGKIYIEVPGLRYWVRKDSQKVYDGPFASSNNFLGNLIFDHAYFFELATLLLFVARSGLSMVKGDEFIRLILEVGGQMGTNAAVPENRGAEVVEYLMAVEKDWQKNNPIWKQMFRRLKRAL